MNKKQNAAFLASQTACALIEMQSMVASNQIKIAQAMATAHGEDILVYKEKDFLHLIDKYQLGYNDALSRLFK